METTGSWRQVDLFELKGWLVLNQNTFISMCLYVMIDITHIYSPVYQCHIPMLSFCFTSCMCLERSFYLLLFLTIRSWRRSDLRTYLNSLELIGDVVLDASACDWASASCNRTELEQSVRRTFPPLLKNQADKHMEEMMCCTDCSKSGLITYDYSLWSKVYGHLTITPVCATCEHPNSSEGKLKCYSIPNTLCAHSFNVTVKVWERTIYACDGQQISLWVCLRTCNFLSMHLLFTPKNSLTLHVEVLFLSTQV